MVRNIFYILGSVILFFAGMVFYGMILNLQEVKLADAMRDNGISEIKNPILIIDRKRYVLQLFNENKLVKSYKAVFGKNQSLVKISKEDNVTPIGEYKICAKDTNTQYHKELKLNYPSISDAAEALARNYINQDEYDAIILAQKNNDCPPRETKLGAEISIHGIGTYDIIFRNLPFSFNWTNGSIAISNESIDELYSVTKIGTPVKIIYK